MRYCSEDAPRTGERNVNLNKNTLENAGLNKMFNRDERAPSFIFKQNKTKHISHPLVLHYTNGKKFICCRSFVRFVGL